KKRINSGHVGFNLGPRINAAGRLDNANKVIELLTTTSLKKAKSIAESLNKLNTRRRTVEEAVRDSCISQILEDKQYFTRFSFALYGVDYHLGVIGIAAQRVVEKFYRPVAVMGPGEALIGKEVVPVIKGSVRGIKG